MNKSIKILLALFSVVATVFASSLLISAVIPGDREAAERRQYHLSRAEQFRELGIYVDAINEYSAALRVMRDGDPNILLAVAELHLALFEKHGFEDNSNQYRRTIQLILDNNIPPEGLSIADTYYYHAIPYDLANRRMNHSIELIDRSWRRTQDDRIFRLRHATRHTFTQGRYLFGYATPIQRGTARVMCLDETYWGFVNAEGRVLLSPEFDLATNFSGDFAVVTRDGILQLVDRNGYRRAAADLSINAANIAHFDGSLFALSAHNQSGYIIASRDDFMISTRETVYDFIGMRFNDTIALQLNGMWQIFDFRDSRANTGFVFDSIAVDELGRAVVANRFFARENGRYYLMGYDSASGENSWWRVSDEGFDEARPFFEAGGVAAVRRGNRWGFVDTDGEVIIPFEFEDARSSSFLLAPVKRDGLWGFITLERFPAPWENYFGKIAIEPQFYDAKQFVNGVAPVKIESGWVYISLIMYT
ncbi:MAG: WG repeat-containing protein [Defluviitaleaceae bacterium]|nr:WG repeat-containing protein [Defluviitaleaceae bacterium]